MNRTTTGTTVTKRASLLATAAIATFTACVFTAQAKASVYIPPGPQPVTGLYIAGAAGGNFMQDEHLSVTGRTGAGRYTSNYPVSSTYVSPASAYGYHSSFSPDPGGVAVVAAGYGLSNGLRFELEADYRANGIPGGTEQKYGGLVNAIYDLPVRWLSITPHVGVGAGYMWIERGRYYDRTDSFAYQGILGASLPIPGVPGLAATLDYRFLGLAGAARKFTTPGYSYSGGYYSSSGDPGVGKRKYSDDFNHSILIGLRYAFNAPPNGMFFPTPSQPRLNADRTYMVFFDWDRTDLTARAKQIIAEAASATTRVQVTRIEVNGYTDTSGSVRYNQGLSLRRGNVVTAELVRDGVPRDAISTHGFGESNPLVATGPGVREPQNRRVEIILR